MILNMTGGGGNALHFKVAGGTTRPSDPSENTIWVNTDAQITGWTFCDYNIPTWQSLEGHVNLYFKASHSTTGSINILKKNEISIRPLSAMQYVGGLWLRKPVELYQNGAWQYIGYRLFDSGTSLVPFSVYTANGAASIGVTALNVSSAAGQSKLGGVVYTTNKIDVSDYSTLAVSGFRSGSTALWFGLSSKSAVNYGTDFAGKSSTTTNGVLDIRGFSGSYYIVLAAFDNGSYSCTSVSLS